MPLALVIGDTGSCAGSSINSGSSKTFVCEIGLAHLNSGIDGHGIGEHAGPHINSTGTTGKTITNGQPAAAVTGTGSCGTVFKIATTSRTYISS